KTPASGCGSVVAASAGPAADCGIEPARHRDCPVRRTHGEVRNTTRRCGMSGDNRLAIPHSTLHHRPSGDARAMKLILAIIRPEKLDAVQAALNHRKVYLMTISETFGREQGALEIYRGQTFRRPVSKLRVEVAVADSYLDEAVEAIRRAGFVGDPG